MDRRCDFGYKRSMYEIERKFLIRGTIENALNTGTIVSVHSIKQSYLGNSGKWTFRVRRLICDQEQTTWTMTMKKKVNAKTCIEIESPIDEALYNAIAKQCTCELNKTRTTIMIGNEKWEIDKFHDRPFNKLILAEIELSSEDQKITIPSWVGKEVTEDSSYKNAAMAKKLAKRSSEAAQRRRR